MKMRHFLVALIVILLVPMGAVAQTNTLQDETVASPGTGTLSKPMADLPVVVTGQRQTRDQAAQDAGIEPMGRITNRIQNRVQTRIRNRIDRYYDPQVNATSPFVVAEDQARNLSRRPR